MPNRGPCHLKAQDVATLLELAELNDAEEDFKAAEDAEDKQRFKLRAKILDGLKRLEGNDQEQAIVLATDEVEELLDLLKPTDSVRKTLEAFKATLS